MGATAGSHAITPTGAATYSIPLIIPNGVKEIQPSLSIAYNSQGGDGLMGMGWNLSGLSSIGRMGKDLMHDNTKTAVEGNGNDFFALDGARLVMDNTANVYGGDGVTYSTESESFSRITSHSTLSGGPEWFEVETKSGLTYEYGNVPTARYQKQVGSSQSGAVLMWMLNKVYDKFGNFMTFSYLKDHNCPRIDQILYTGNGANSIPNKIKFSYDQRPNPSTSYLAATPVTSYFLLTGIAVTVSGSTYRKYELAYSSDGIHAFLNSVTENGNNGEHFNSTIFKYPEDLAIDKDLEGHTTSASIFGGTPNGQWNTGDFNGDGYSDIVSFTGHKIQPDPNSSLEVYVTDMLHLYMKQNNGNDFDWVYTEPMLGGQLTLADNSIQYASKSSDIGDFNGDGKEEILVMTTQAMPTSYFGTNLQHVITNIYYPVVDMVGNITGVTPTFAGFGLMSDPLTVGIDLGFIDASKPYKAIGDFDGDGSSDYILITHHQNTNPDISNPTYICFPSKNKSGVVWNTGGIGNSALNGETEELLVTDMNGNGKNELLFLRRGICEFYEMHEDAGGNIVADLIYSDGYPNNWQKVHPGDFNADGKTDFLIAAPHNPNDNYYDWTIAYSKGNGFTSTTFNFTTEPNMGYEDIHYGTNIFTQNVILGDFNGDGMSDILHSYGNSNSTNNKFHFYYSRGNNGFLFTDRTVDIGNSFTTIYQSFQRIGDFNGDGRADVLLRKGMSDPIDLLYIDANKKYLLEKVADGFNRKTAFQYKTLTEPGTHYTKGTSATYPLQDIAVGPLSLVTAVLTPDGIGGTHTVSYEYEAAKAHKEGRGFLGFEQVRENNPAMNELTTTYFGLNTDYYVPYLLRTKVENTQQNHIVSDYEQSTSFIAMPNNRYWQRNNGGNITDIAGVYTYTSLDYDNYGNIIDETVGVSPSNGSGNIQGMSTIYTYPSTATTGAWIPSKPIASTISKSTGFTQTNTYTYNATTGALLSETEFSGKPQA